MKRRKKANGIGKVEWVVGYFKKGERHGGEGKYIYGDGEGPGLCINPEEKKAPVHVQGSVPPSTWGSNHLNPISLIISTWPPTLPLNYNVLSHFTLSVQFPISTTINFTIFTIYVSVKYQIILKYNDYKTAINEHG